MEIFVGIGSFLGGALVTAFGYTLFITNKLSTLTARFNDHIEKTGQACPLHGDISTRVSLGAAESRDIKRRVENLEERPHNP